MNCIRKHKNPFIVVGLLLCATTLYAADTILTDLTELASAVDDDMIYIVDDPNGTPADRKIPRQEFLLSWIGSTNITTLGTIATGTWNGSDIALTTYTSGNYAAGDAEAGSATSGDSATDFFDAGELADARIPDAHTNSTVTVTDNENADEGNALAFVAGADLDGSTTAALESDGDFTYNPSTGTVTATEFVGGGAGITGLTVTVSDDESTNDNQEIVFTTDNAALESDGDFYYNPSTGIVTATGFAGDVTGALTGNADTVTNATFTTALTVDTGTVTLTGNVANSSVLTIGAGAVSVSGTNTGDNTDAETGDSATAFFDAGTIETTYGGTGADLSAVTGVMGMNAGAYLDIDTFAELNTAIADKTLVNEEDAATWDALGTFALGLTITGADADPTAAGMIRYDSTVAGMSGGALRWYDDDSVRILVDLETDATDDDYVVAYDADADGFYMKVDDDSGGATAYDDITDPDAAGSISFDDGETATYTTAQDAAGSFFSLINSNADVSNQVYMLDLDYSADTTQDNADFIRLQDAGSTLMVFGEEGKIVMTPSGVDDAVIISMVPSTALTQAAAEWYGMKIDGAALDPGAADNKIIGVEIDLSGVDTTNDPYVEALELKMYTGGTAIDIEEGVFHHDYTVGAAAGAEYTAYDVIVHAESMNAAASMHVLDVALSAGDPSGDISAIGTHSFVGVIDQSIGTYTSQSTTELQGRKGTGGTVWADVVDGQEVFVANADEIYIGDDAATGAQFNEIQVVMGTPGTKTVNPTFWYNTAADAWTQFYPSDDTLGFQQSGLIRWTLDDISASWTNDGDPCGADSTAGWWIKIIRNDAPDPGTPTITTAKTGTVTNYTWGKTGAVDVLSMEADTITEGGVGVPNLDEIDWVAAAEMADADHGDVAWSSGDATVQSMTVNDAGAGTYYLGVFAADTGVDQPIYTDGALSYTQATGTLAATEFSGGGASLTAINAATGDSATDFFDAGEIADARISDTLTSSSCTGNAATATSAATVAIDEDPTNEVASGMTTTFTAATNVVFGDVCYIDSAGKMEIGDADAIASSSCIGMAIATISADASGNFLLVGIACDTDWDWTVGGIVYLTVTGTSTNTLSQTAPTATDDVVQIMGVATHADRMYFKPELVQIELE